MPDTGTGASLDFVAYRFNSGNADYQSFTSDGATAIANALSGTTFDPSDIRITDSDFNSIATGGSAIIYIRVQDASGNINYPDAQLTIRKVDSSQDSSAESTTNVLLAPSVLNLNQAQEITLRNLTGSAQISIYNSAGRRLATTHSTGGTSYTLPVGQLIGNVRSGIYFIRIEQSGAAPVTLRFALIR